VASDRVVRITRPPASVVARTAMASVGIWLGPEVEGADVLSEVERGGEPLLVDHGVAVDRLLAGESEQLAVLGVDRERQVIGIDRGQFDEQRRDLAHGQRLGVARRARQHLQHVEALFEELLDDHVTVLDRHLQVGLVGGRSRASMRWAATSTTATASSTATPSTTRLRGLAWSLGMAESPVACAARSDDVRCEPFYSI
jgi:hypothetical protein